MRLAWLAWYVVGVGLLLALATSLITFVTEGQYLGIVLPVVFLGIASAAAVAAIGLGRLPPEHPLQHSKPLWGLFGVVAVVATLMLLGVVG